MSNVNGLISSKVGMTSKFTVETRSYAAIAHLRVERGWSVQPLLIHLVRQHALFMIGSDARDRRLRLGQAI